MVLVLNELQKVLKATNATFDKLMVCLSCATRFNLETLLKGYKEGAGMEGIHGIVKRIVQIENRDGSRLTKLMESYIDKYQKCLLFSHFKCVTSYHSLIGLKNLAIEPSFQEEKWLTVLKELLAMRKSGVRSLLCITASYVKSWIGRLDCKNIASNSPLSHTQRRKGQFIYQK
jgi:hypothetical protein